MAHSLYAYFGQLSNMCNQKGQNYVNNDMW